MLPDDLIPWNRLQATADTVLFSYIKYTASWPAVLLSEMIEKRIYKKYSFSI